MPTAPELEAAFKTYFDEIDRCLRPECYWALLHVVVALPDVCAALEQANGETNGARYQEWCDAYWPSTISGKRRWEIRCALLHQGRTALRSGETFSYVEPQGPGSKIHEYVHPGEPNTTLVVDRLADEVKAAIRLWFAALQQPANAALALNVARHLRLVASERPKDFQPGAPPTASRHTTSSTS